MQKKFFILVVLALTSGCATQTFYINGSSGDTPTDERSQHFFLSGIGQQKFTDAARICGGADNVIKVESHHSFLNGFLGVITYGIYTPRDAKVYCKS